MKFSCQENSPLPFSTLVVPARELFDWRREPGSIRGFCIHWKRRRRRRERRGILLSLPSPFHCSSGALIYCPCKWQKSFFFPQKNALVFGQKEPNSFFPMFAGSGF